MGRFRFGQVIEAYISDGTGRTKERPAVVISNDDDNDQGQDLLVIAITRRIEDLETGPSRRRPSGLETRSGDGPHGSLRAKCHWVREVKQDKVIRSLGMMPPDLLKVIVEAFDKIQADPDFDDWT